MKGKFKQILNLSLGIIQVILVTSNTPPWSVGTILNVRFIEDYISGFALSEAFKYFMQCYIYDITGLL